MKATNSINHSSLSINPNDRELNLVPLRGADITIREGFQAKSFRALEIGKAMDPIVLLDHYTMTAPTFGTHPHAGLAAVSLIFPDSEGRFHNLDSLGNDFDLMPGDLYWLQASRGVLHNESPRESARIHGLQIFVNIGQALRHDKPKSLLVRAQEMPVISNGQHRVRVALGASNGVVGDQSLGSAMTILDGYLHGQGSFEHELGGGRNAWLHCIHTDTARGLDREIDTGIEVTVAGTNAKLRGGQAIAIENAGNAGALSVHISTNQNSRAHFVLLDGEPINEPFAQQGPFVGGSIEEVEAFKHAFENDQFGTIG